MYIDEVQLARPIEGKSYLKEIPAVKWLMRGHSIKLNKKVTFIVGENGTGKSTLIEAIAIASGFNPEGGSYNIRFHTENSHSGLWENLRLVRRGKPKDGFFLRAESFYNVASYIDQTDRDPGAIGGGPRMISSYGGVSLHKQSHGESFMSMIRNRLGGHGLYLFDEPEAALSPSRIMTLIVEMDRLVKENSQLIISTHSPMLMAFPDSEVLELSDNGIKKVDYRDTEHYIVSRSFLNNPEKMLGYLLNDNEKQQNEEC